MNMLLHVGIDDTDSEEGMCTTYVGAVIIDELRDLGVDLVGFPKLVRLNPNWKFKTRGNCAVAFDLELDEEMVSRVKKLILERVEEMAELHVEKTTPGVVFYEGEEIPIDLRSYSHTVVREIMTIEEAEQLAAEVGAEVHKFKEGRGIIGALAAIGHALEDDYTYELITYRIPENRGTPRRIVEGSVGVMDRVTYPETFDNLDPDTGEIRITPHTPGPILYGIRSETAQAAKKARDLVDEDEPVERYLLYMTNQGTDEHLQKVKVEDIEPYISVIVEGVVTVPPRTITGGHVFFAMEDRTGRVNCAAFEPTRRFRHVVRKLVPGDRVRVYGGVKEKTDHPLTVNLERLEVLELKTVKRRSNPTCENCGRRMKSKGRDKGYYCEGCGMRLPSDAIEEIEFDRELEIRPYEVPPRARRHLAKPLVRMRRFRV